MIKKLVPHLTKSIKVLRSFQEKSYEKSEISEKESILEALIRLIGS